MLCNDKNFGSIKIAPFPFTYFKIHLDGLKSMEEYKEEISENDFQEEERLWVVLYCTVYLPMTSRRHSE